MELTEHFTLEELTKTNTGIENVPNEEQVLNLKRVCRWLERLHFAVRPKDNRRRMNFIR